MARCTLVGARFLCGLNLPQLAQLFERQFCGQDSLQLTVFVLSIGSLQVLDEVILDQFKGTERIARM